MRKTSRALERQLSFVQQCNLVRKKVQQVLNMHTDSSLSCNQGNCNLFECDNLVCLHSVWQAADLWLQVNVQRYFYPSK